MNTSIKAKETIYNGYRFRSRLEARWAVFFDTLGIRYEYEWQDYVVGGKRYLPDFWLPEQQCFVEIKGQDPKDSEIEKIGDLACATQKNAHLFFGGIKLPPDIDSLGWSAEYWKQDDDFWGINWKWNPLWGRCIHCGSVGIVHLGKSSLLSCGCSHRHRYTENFEYNACDPVLIAAYTAARQARFEHGEKPVLIRPIG